MAPHHSERHCPEQTALCRLGQQLGGGHRPADAGGVRGRTTHKHIRRYVDLFHTIPKVLDVARVTGKDCFVVRWAFAFLADLERVVDALAAHGSVTTALMLSQSLHQPPPVER